MIGDHIRLYKSLNAHRVRYLVIGGTAAIIYGVPRTTVDIDILIEKTTVNAKRILQALKAANFGTAHLTTPESLLRNEITIFEDYLRLDVLTEAKGIDFMSAWKRRQVRIIRGVHVKFASLEDIIQSKRAMARSIDLQDLEILLQIQKRLSRHR